MRRLSDRTALLFALTGLIRLMVMPKAYIAISVISVILSFIGGFLVANALNRSGGIARNQVEKIGSDPATRTAIRTRRPFRMKKSVPDRRGGRERKLCVQRDLGLALYRYSAMSRIRLFCVNRHGCSSVR